MSTAADDRSATADDRSAPGSPLRAALARDARSALVPVGACALALLLLTAYTATGAAGESAPRIQVGAARVLQPSGAAEPADVLFEVRNTGGTDDTLLYADFPELGISMVREPRRKRPGSTPPAKTVTVRAHSTVRMTEDTFHLMVLEPPVLKPGRKIAFDLWFTGSGRVAAEAEVVAADRS
ncbi:copper chaperone PCu(A)C [Streptomyces sp. NPDC048636]|uniref:copper chaperone PCu(A)C n=1 Tax=Streptomyces sp. NPDC048636 TaxID=3155762 RepID=UPI003431DCD2